MPYTKSQPKEMIPVLDKPALQYVVEEAAASGIRDILIITARTKRAVEDHFDMNGSRENSLVPEEQSPAMSDLHELMRKVRIHYTRQQGPHGLGDAIACAEGFVGREPFAVLLGDDLTMNPPCTQVVLDAYRHVGGVVVGLQEVPPEDIGRYGMAVGKEIEPGVLRLTDFVEKPRPEEVRSSLAAIGRYVLSPEIFEVLRSTEPGKNGEIQLTDAIKSMISSGNVHGVVYRGVRYDVGDVAGWLKATLAMASGRAEYRHVLQEVMSQSDAKVH